VEKVQYMKTRRYLLVVAVCLLFWKPAYAHHLAVVTQPANHAQSVSTPELRRIVKAELRKWPSGENVVFVFNRNSAASMQIVARLCHLAEPEAVKFFNDQKGFGFVMPDSGSGDIYLHASALRRSGVQAVEPDQRIRYSTRQGNKGVEVDKVEII